MVTFDNPFDVDAYYVRHGIDRLRVLARWQDRLDPRTFALVVDWLRRYDDPPLALNQPPVALGERERAFAWRAQCPSSDR